MGEGESAMYMDNLYWNILESLLSDGYRIVKFENNQEEIWLESSTKRAIPFIRLVRHDVDWANWIWKDVMHTGRVFEILRKKRLLRTAHAVVIYVTTNPPVDNWEKITKSRIIAQKKEKTTVQSVVIHEANVQEGLNSIGAKLQRSLTITLPRKDVTPIEVQQTKHQVLTLGAIQLEQEKEIFNYGKPYVTYVIMAVQIILFLLMELSGGSTNTHTLVLFGAKYNPYILDGEWWRFITPVFLHIGFLHLLLNTYALYYLGVMVEKLYGSRRFIVIYLFAGFTGVLGSFIFSDAISAGASGAIFGCFGALIYFGRVQSSLHYRTIGGNIIALMVINLVLGFVLQNVDNAGHIGGLIGGFLCARIVQSPRQTSKKYTQLLAFIEAVLVVDIFLYIGFRGII